MRLILSCLLFVGLALASPQEKKQYTTKYDNINIDEILNNDRLYQKYFNCLANKGQCTPDAKELKEDIPDALKDKCAKCSDRQKKALEKILRFLIEKKRADLETLEKIYDPQGLYKKRYQADAAARGIKL